MNKKYIKDYEIDYTGKKPRPVYKGPLYYFEMEPGGLKNAKIFLLTNSLLSACLFVLMSFAGDKAVRIYYVGIPYMFLIVPAFYSCVDATKFLMRDKPMERMHYEGSFMHLISWAFASMIFSGAAIIGDIIFLIKSESLPLFEFFFTPLAALLFLSSFVSLRKTLKLKACVKEIPPVLPDAGQGE